MTFISIIALLATLILETRAILDTDKIKRLTERVYGARLIVIGKEINPEFMCAASLAHHSLLGSVDTMKLFGTDLSPVPPKHLASLTSCVTGRLIVIENVSGCDLVTLFTSLKCEELYIKKQSLGREETQAMVQAMETGVLGLSLVGGMTLDIKAFTEYSGLGSCRIIMCITDNPALDRIIEELITWANATL